MSKRIVLVLLTAMVAATSAAAPPAKRTSSATDGQELNLTVYSSGRALVTDRRPVDLPKGDVELQFGDVAESIMPETVAIRSGSGGIDVLEQNYEYDLLSPKKLLDKYVGKELTLVYRETKESSSVERRVQATLLANNEQPVWRIGERIVTGGFADRFEFDQVPENLIARPSLVWLLASDRGGSRSLEVSYLTGGIGWKSDYVLTLDEKGDRAALEGWVTIQNNSGATYRDARLQLIAGDVHQVAEERVPMTMMAKTSAVREEGFEEKAFFEYHLYTLQRPATVKQNQQKQISLLHAEDVAVEKVLRLRGQRWYFLQRYGGGDAQKIEVALRVRNEAKNQLGKPLPKGIVRVYQRDTDGSSQFVGEDRIDHTPKDETLDLTIGNAFDVVAERVQSDYRVISNCVHESAYRIEIRNHKAEAIEVMVTEPLGGDWEMVQESHPHRKVSAFEAEWTLPVPAGGKVELTYRVRVRNC